MMKGKKLEKMLSSIIRSQLDDDHTEKIEGKKGIEDKVDKILKLINTREKDVFTSDERAELVSYINSLSSSYQSLYGRYDLLIEKLQNSVQLKNEKRERSSESSSSNESSDSEANEYFTPKKNFHRNAEIETHHFSQSSLARADIKNQRSELEVTAKLAEKESTIVGLLEDLKQSKETVTSLEAENTKILEESKKEQEVMIEMLGNIQKENEALLVEKSVVLEKLFASEEYNKKLTTEWESVKGNIEKLEHENAQLINDINEALRNKEDKSIFNTENVEDLNKLQESENETKEIEKEMKRLREQITTLEQNVKVLQDHKSSLERIMEEKNKEVMSLQKQLSEPQNATSLDTEPTVSHVNDLQQELNSLRSQYDLEKQATAMAEDISEGMIQMGKLESNLISKISNQVTKLNKQKDSCDRVKSGCKLKNEADQKKFEETEAIETIRQLKTVQEDQEKNIIKLQDNLKEALSKLKLTESQKADADKEVKNLKEIVQTLEVHLRLLDQKLKITKSEFKEKDENHKRKIKDLEERYQKLDEHGQLLYGDIHGIEDELRKIYAAVGSKTEDRGVCFQNMESSFEEKCGHFMSLLSKFSEQFRIAKQDFGTVVSKKQEKDNETIKEEIRSLEEKIVKKEKERECLEGKMLEMEQKLKEKEEEGKLKDEGKREAIRQLCLSIEYYREICNHLMKNLSGYRKITNSSR